jgi:hypothetical protein
VSRLLENAYRYSNYAPFMVCLKELLLHHAWHIEQYPTDKYTMSSQVSLLDELERTMLFIATGATTNYDNSQQHPGSAEDVQIARAEMPSLLPLAVESGLYLYARYRLEQDRRGIQTQGRPLLDCALERYVTNEGATSPDLDDHRIRPTRDWSTCSCILGLTRMSVCMCPTTFGTARPGCRS